MTECLPGACFSHNLPSVSLTLAHPRYQVPVNECHPQQDMLQTSEGDLSIISVENGTKSEMEWIIFLKLSPEE